jgi:hypothetical protein
MVARAGQVEGGAIKVSRQEAAMANRVTTPSQNAYLRAD